MIFNPLVSIPVITYNSSSYILDGLESIKNQTYKNIELIISDDCSTDNTVEICRKWLDENQQYFKRAILVTTDKNTGVAGNLNRAIREAQGEWIKTLSGDDKFLPYTIQGYIDYLQEHPECNIAFAKLKINSDDQEVVSKANDIYERLYYSKIRTLDQKRQKRLNLRQLFVPGPGLIYRKSLWSQVGGFDERYPFCEEDPFMLKVFDAKERVYFIDGELYVYYIYKSSLSREKTVISRHIRDRIRHYRDVRQKKQLKHGMLIQLYKETLFYKQLEATEKHSKWLLLYQLLRPIGLKTRITTFFQKYIK